MSSTSLQVIKSLIIKSIQLATQCKHMNDTQKQERMWKLACSYVKRAKDLIEPQQWKLLSNLEIQILENEIPCSMEITFFDDGDTHKATKEEDENGESSYSDYLSSRKMQDLVNQINHLKDIQHQYRVHNNQLQEEYDHLKEIHENHMNKSEVEQSELQDELRQLMNQVEDVNHLKEDTQFMEKELNKFREKVTKIHRKNRSEINSLMMELDAAHYELEVANNKLQQNNLTLSSIMEKLKHCQDQINQYQSVFAHLVPLLDDKQLQVLNQYLFDE